MRINIYQLDSDKDENRVKFCNYDFTQQHGGVLPQSYKCVFHGDVDGNLEDVFTLFNTIDFDSSRCAEMDGIRMLMIQPHKTPVVTYVKQDLSSLQRAVSDHCEEAFIEYTYPFDDDCMILGNEEAKLCGMEGNRRLFGSVYAGPIFITRDNCEGDLCALTDEQVKTYGEMFAVPEDISPAEVQRDVGFTFYGWG